MTLEQGFTRKETMELTRSTSNQLQYLERANLVVPAKITEGRKQPKVYYTWNQILELKVIRNLRENTSLQTIRKVLDFFEEYKEKKSLHDKRIVAINDEVFWIKQDLSNLHQSIAALKIADKRNKGIGQYSLIVLPTIKEVVEEILSIAEESQVIDLKTIAEKRYREERTIAA